MRFRAVARFPECDPVAVDDGICGDDERVWFAAGNDVCFLSGMICCEFARSIPGTFSFVEIARDDANRKTEREKQFIAPGRGARKCDGRQFTWLNFDEPSIGNARRLCIPIGRSLVKLAIDEHISGRMLPARIVMRVVHDAAPGIEKILAAHLCERAFV